MIDVTDRANSAFCHMLGWVLIEAMMRTHMLHIILVMVAVITFVLMTAEPRSTSSDIVQSAWQQNQTKTFFTQSNPKSNYDEPSD